ncbi:hypothetical protein M885DRAFT_611581, partial [Pelagophyceae sp. CCMP2097]
MDFLALGSPPPLDAAAKRRAAEDARAAAKADVLRQRAEVKKLHRAALVRQRDEYAAMVAKLAGSSSVAAAAVRLKAEQRLAELDAELGASAPAATTQSREPQSRTWRRQPRALDAIAAEARALPKSAAGTAAGGDILKKYSVSAVAHEKKRADAAAGGAGEGYLEAPLVPAGPLTAPPTTAAAFESADSILRKYSATNAAAPPPPPAKAADHRESTSSNPDLLMLPPKQKQKR